jgi:hypothetical protein
MNEQALREMYAMAVIQAAGVAPESVFTCPLSPIMLKFAESIVRRCAELADEGDSYQTYNLGAEICEEFGLTR